MRVFSVLSLALFLSLLSTSPAEAKDYEIVFSAAAPVGIYGDIGVDDDDRATGGTVYAAPGAEARFEFPVHEILSMGAGFDIRAIPTPELGQLFRIPVFGRIQFARFDVVELMGLFAVAPSWHVDGDGDVLMGTTIEGLLGTRLWLWEDLALTLEGGVLWGDHVAEHRSKHESILMPTFALGIAAGF